MGFWGWVVAIIVGLIVLANLEAVFAFIGVLLVIALVLGAVGGVGYGIYKVAKGGIEAEKKRLAEAQQEKKDAQEREMWRKERERFDNAVQGGADALISYIEQHEDMSSLEVPAPPSFNEEAKNELRAMFAERVLNIQSLDELNTVKSQAPLHLVPGIFDDLDRQELVIQESIDRNFAESKGDISALSLYVKKWEPHTDLFIRKWLQDSQS